MAKEKENKTNAMRILDKNKINYEVNTYECDEFHRRRTYSGYALDSLTKALSRRL